MVGIAEGDAAHHAAVVAEIEVAANQSRMARERGLREGADIGAAIDRAVDAERRGGVDDRNMRGAEEVVVFQRLLGVGRFVAAGNPERVVELEAALAATLQIDTEIFARIREVAIVRRAGSSLRVDRLPEPLLGLAACDHDLPGLAVAPGRRALRHLEHMRDNLARYG